mgnify:CR=1 FL=1
MKDSFRQQFERLALRLAELEATLADPRVAADMKRFRELTRERLGRVRLDLDLTVRDGDERWRIRGEIATFVRDLETGACASD